MPQILPTEFYAVKNIHKISDNVRSTDAQKCDNQNELSQQAKQLSSQETGPLTSG